MEIKYVAIDGEVFSTREECEAYESTSINVIDAQFAKLPIQLTENFAEDGYFSAFSCDDAMYAVRIENVEQLEIVNKWLDAHSTPDKIGIDKIGTIQLIDMYGDWAYLMGTPAEVKEKYSKAIDNLCNKLIQKN